MKYKLIGDNDVYNPIDTILKNRNITKELFELTDEVIEDYNNYDNMGVAISTFLKHINNKSKIVILVD